MRPFGFSTGALALSDFHSALNMMKGKSLNAVELSTLRKHELPNLISSSRELDLSQFEYVSVHAPSSFSMVEEEEIVNQLKHFMPYQWPIVLHPDTIHNFELWVGFGNLLYIENMDKRKSYGRTAEELRQVFKKLPEASLCFDLAHVHQVDSSMTEAYLILRSFGDRVRQLHVSELDTNAKHHSISFNSILAFNKVAHLIPKTAPAILESQVAETEIDREIRQAMRSLKSDTVVADRSIIR